MKTLPQMIIKHSEIMADIDEHSRLIKCINEIGKRVEFMREQALSVEREKETLLATLQQMQDNSNVASLSKDQRHDIEFSTERLVLRCLTVDVSVTTPRNENQEAAFESVSRILNNLYLKVKENPLEHEKHVITHLNACLAEPISNNINLRFQDKILSCTADDQKHFRKRLEEMLEWTRKSEENLVNPTNSGSTESSQSEVQNGNSLENGIEPSHSESDMSEETS